MKAHAAIQVTVVLAVAACASALREPTPIDALAPHRAHGSADELVHQAQGAWDRRAEPGQAEAAQGLYLDAAVADPHRVDALLGAMHALAYRIEHEHVVARGKLADVEVQVGQWCVRRAPGSSECAYRLAIAIGQQARERPSTGRDALHVMVDLLRRAIAGAPRLDSGGPHRVLALVLLRAPSWPLGPGDPEAALVEARAAAAIAPEVAENQLVLAEALVANDRGVAAHVAYAKALALATTAQRSGDPDAPNWIAQAKAGLGSE